MARRNDPDDRKAVLRGDRGADKRVEQEQEQEQEVEKDPEALETARMQNQYGNAAIAALVNSETAGAGAGIEIEPAKRADEEQEVAQDFGGEPDPADPGLTELDLTRSWNPGTTYPTDRPKFVEPMPDDELPPEDRVFIEAVSRRAAPKLPPSTGLDALLQPSPEVLAATLRGFTRGVLRLCGASADRRALAMLAHRSAPLLQDADGRVLVARARVAALAACALMRSPVLGGDAATAATVDFLLELEGREHRVKAARARLGGPEELPLAGKLFTSLVGEPAGRVRPARLPGPATGAFVAAARAMLALDDPEGLVPELRDPAGEADDPDDALGLDAVLVAMTGGPRDPAEAVYRAGVQAAERLAAAATQTRVRFAGVAFATAETARLWSAGAPNETLYAVCRALDDDTAAVLTLLLEIARAAQKRAVPARGLRNGLLRAARSLEQARAQAIERLSQVAGGILPGAGRLGPMDAAPADALAAAWADGNPVAALDALAAEPDGVARDAAIAFSRLATAEDADAIRAELRALRRRAADAPYLWAATGTALAACALRAGDPDEAARLGAEQRAFAVARRNGVLLADGAIAEMEAHVTRGEADAAFALRLEAGAAAWHLGARGALTLLARWAPRGGEEG